MNIPLVDLKTQYQTIKAGVDKAVLKILSQGNYILGEEVETFEKEFARYCGTKYCVGVASGSDALLLALRALSIGPGDEVIAPANTFISTVLPIVYLGARPVLVDIDPETYQIDPQKLEKTVTKKTKVVLPVHLYGFPAPMIEILKVAKRYNLLVLEDTCQAHGATLNNKKCGSFGDIAAFSFYPGKNLGANGDGGAVTTNDKDLATILRQMRNIGQIEKYKHDIIGYNSRLDTIHAAVLSLKLKKLDAWNNKRRKAALWYKSFLSKTPVVLPIEPTSTRNGNFHLFVIRTPKRDSLLEFLKNRGVGVGIHYPIPIHLQKSLSSLGYKKGDFPITEKYANEMLSLPIYPEITREQVRFVCKQIKEFIKNE